MRGQEPLRREEIGEAGGGERRAHGAEPLPPVLSVLPKRRLRAMLMAGVEALECQRVLAAGGINLVSEVLRGQGEFVEYEHYPRNDVHDPDTGSQYYYHAHRGSVVEHGHFHTFLRWSPHTSGAADRKDASITDEADSVTHLIAISMDPYGFPIGLFAVNRWVCGGTWLAADETIDILPRFRIDHAYPSWPVNRWIGAMIVLFRPHIEVLLSHRDAVIAAWAAAHPGTDAFEDRALEVTGHLPVSVEDTVREVRALAGIRDPG